MQTNKKSFKTCSRTQTHTFVDENVGRQITWLTVWALRLAGSHLVNLPIAILMYSRCFISHHWLQFHFIRFGRNCVVLSPTRKIFSDEHFSKLFLSPSKLKIRFMDYENIFHFSNAVAVWYSINVTISRVSKEHTQYVRLHMEHSSGASFCIQNTFFMSGTKNWR